MEKRIHKAGWIPYAAAVLMCLTLLSGSLVSGLYARFATGTSGEDSARAAAFVFDVNGEEHMIDLSGICKPGDEKRFEFSISNKYAEGAVSEVAERYTVTFQELGSLPLQYKLTDNPQILTASGNIGELNAANTFSAAIESSKTYILTVTWPSDMRDVKYASGSGVASLSMKIMAQQID